MYVIGLDVGTSGQPADPMYGAYKMRCIAKNRPDLLGKTKRVLVIGTGCFSHIRSVFLAKDIAEIFFAKIYFAVLWRVVHLSMSRDLRMANAALSQLS